jgi:hypothetical protein
MVRIMPDQEKSRAPEAIIVGSTATVDISFAGSGPQQIARHLNGFNN